MEQIAARREQAEAETLGAGGQRDHLQRACTGGGHGAGAARDGDPAQQRPFLEGRVGLALAPELRVRGVTCAGHAVAPRRSICNGHFCVCFCFGGRVAVGNKSFEV